jgi:hypothetical protein
VTIHDLPSSRTAGLFRDSGRGRGVGQVFVAPNGPVTLLQSRVVYHEAREAFHENHHNRSPG